MSNTRYLTRDEYWQEIESRVPSARRVSAAIAYLGTGASEYLPLREGHRLVVDMSLGAVRQGATNPHEIKRLIDNGVEVFSCDNLHAKVLVIDGVVICTSANVSSNARVQLVEAALMTTSRSAVLKAERFIEALLAEPVLPGYLKKCLAEYRPPRFKAARTVRKSPAGSVDAIAWFVGGLVYYESELDREEIQNQLNKSKGQQSDPKNCELDFIRFHKKPVWFSKLSQGCWIVDCARVNRRKREVGPPSRLVRTTSYTSRRTGQTRYLLVIERPLNGEVMSYSDFKNRWKASAPSNVDAPVRTQPIRDAAIARKVLRFWTSKGRVVGLR